MRVFREYLGAQGQGVRFDHVPINQGVEFHFILSFAIDYTPDAQPQPTNGVFIPFWDTNNLTPQAVIAAKRRNNNVRVMLSVGGDTVGGREGHPATFRPVDEASWLANAFRTLTGLIDQYHLDGVDIDYESFATDDTAPFVRCIGELLRRLKASKPGIITSIAPYSSTGSHYQALWAQYRQYIDYINFQFYANQPTTTMQEYLENYNQQAANYPGGTVLAAINTTNPRDGTFVPMEVALNACRALKQQGRLRGIFIWSADSSLANQNGWGFRYEVASQEMLAN